MTFLIRPFYRRVGETKKRYIDFIRNRPSMGMDWSEYFMGLNGYEFEESLDEEIEKFRNSVAGNEGVALGG